jgi:lipopolysaccharide heptosyltransferase II
MSESVQLKSLSKVCLEVMKGIVSQNLNVTSGLSPQVPRFLVVNVNWVGDVIFSSPVFKALKETYPRAHIACLVPPRVREVVESIPQIDEMIVYDEEGRHKNPFAKLRLVYELRKRRFDAAFLLHRSLTRAFLVFLAGIPQRIGYATKGRGMFLTQRIKPSGGSIHRCDDYLNVVRSFGIPVKDGTASLNVTADAQAQVKEILISKDVKEDDFVVVIHPGGNWNLKRWPKDNFILLAQALTEDFQARVVISGGPQEAWLVEEIAAALKNRPIVLAGSINLKHLIALMRRADLVISADSGPLHIASSVGSDVIGIFGPTRTEVTGPRGKGRAFILLRDVGCNREPCYYLQCPDNICMQAVTVEDILDVVRQIRNP